MRNPETTESKAAEMAMRRLAAIVESSEDAIIGKDLNGIITSWNKGAEKIFGYTADEMVGTSILRLFPPERRVEESYVLEKIRSGEKVECFETVRQTKGGRLIDIAVSISPIKDANGNIIGASKIARDITVQKAHQQEILRLTRLYAALSQINQSIVWTRNRKELFEKICRVLVELGQFSMAWIGQADAKTRRINPVAQWGDESGYLSQLTMNKEEGLEGQGLFSTVISEGKSYICNDFAQNPNDNPWYMLANRAGYRAMAAFPIRQNGAVWGGIMVYSSEIGFFRDNEISLLKEAASDVSFALDFLTQDEIRRQAEAAMRESDERYRALFDRSLDCVFLYDFDGKFLDANKAALDLLGYQREDIATLTFASLLTADQLPLAFQVTEEIKANGYQKHATEFRLHGKDGRQVYTETQSSLICREGKPIAIQGIARDLTERKQAEEALIESEKNFRELVQNMPIALVACAPDTRILYANPMASRVLGLNLEQILGKTASDPIWRFIRENGTEMPQSEYPVNLALQAAEGTISDIILGIPRLNGEDTIWVQCNGYTVRNMDGDIQQVVITFTDLTERKQAEASRARLATAVEQSAESIIITNTSKAIVYVNPAFETMSGYNCAEVLGKNPSILSSGKHDATFYCRMWDVLQSGEAWHGHFINIRKDGKPYEVEATISPVRDAVGAVINYVAVQRDVTHEVQLEAQLNQAQKMEAIGVLAGGIAHDFNNILGAIFGYTEMALEDTPPGSLTASDLEQVVLAATRAKELVNQILAFSREAETNKIPLQPATLVKETVKLLRSSLPTTITIRQNIEAKTGTIMADPTQIHQILMNLCTNAYHAMEEKTGGILTITLKNKMLSAADSWICPNIELGDFIELSIKDNGTGIPKEIQERIFEPYFTTKERGKGTGLGLAIVHGIVQSYHGCITCHSEPGEGTVFTIFLPVVERQAEKGGKPVESIPSGTERILFVDDEEILAVLGKSVLERLGYTITITTKSLEALNIFRNQPDAYDLVITDQTMPEMTGIDLAKRMLQIRPNLPIILCTGYSNQITKEKIRDIGIKGFAMKPLAKIDIAVLIRKILDEMKRT